LAKFAQLNWLLYMFFPTLNFLSKSSVTLTKVRVTEDLRAQIDHETKAGALSRMRQGFFVGHGSDFYKYNQNKNLIKSRDAYSDKETEAHPQGLFLTVGRRLILSGSGYRNEV